MRKSRRRSALGQGVFLLALVARSASVHAQVLGEGRGHPVTLREAIDSALRHNVDLGASRSAADSARSETKIARAWPNPTLATIPNTPFQYSATLPLDVGPQRSLRVEASRLGADAARADLGETNRQVILAVQRAFYDVLLADAKATVVQGRRDVVRQVVSADSARVRAGDLPVRALLRSQLELLRTEADLARAGIDRKVTRLTLQGLMGAEVNDTSLRVEGTMGYRELVSGPRIVRDTAISARPDVQATRIREAQSGAAQRLARLQVLPVPQLSYVRQFNAPFESGHYYAFGVGFELPVLNRYTGQRERADASHEMAGFARRRVEAQARREIQFAIVEFDAQRDLVLRYEAGVVGTMRENVDAARYAYQRGSTSLLELLDALRTQQDMLTDYNQALHDYWLAAFALEAATGVPVR